MQKSKMVLWIVGSLGFLWNFLRSLNFMMQMKADALASMPDTFHTILANRQRWATAAFGLGVIGGAIGCILLLLKCPATVYVFMASLMSIVVHLPPNISGANLPAQFSIGDAMLVFFAEDLKLNPFTAHRALNLIGSRKRTHPIHAH
jgi:hypothetical protein